MRLPSQHYSAASRRSYHIGMRRTTSGGVKPSVCVDATVGNGQACVSLPIIGRKCLPAPGVPNLGRASVCCNVKTTWGIPTGAKCCLKYQGQDVVCKSFGL
jgi:hypothetical protein